MAHAIWKYPLDVTDAQTVEIPRYAKPLAVQMQNGTPTMWAMVEPANDPVTMRIRIYGTGHEIDEPWHTYLGTFQMSDGALVFHVFYGPA